ncbi:MAG: SIMPL domain-containing protein [Alphaproteobacteria bacterium]|nr:SIMPL domain-containing protein [Alphaproteobacteria bacterium]
MNTRAIAIGSGFVIVAALAAAALIGPRSSMSASDNALPRIISVSGLGEVKTPPDMATISSGVVSEAASAKDALAKNNAAMAAVIAALKNAGVVEDDIQTSDFSVSPKYPPYQPNQTTPQRIVGYTVSNTVTAQIKNLKNLGPILDTLVQSGSNQINGISFGINEPKKTLDEARKKAAADARAKAELYAQAAGVSLGRVIQITESSAVVPPVPMYRMAVANQAADASVPIAAGQQTVSANVSITFEIQ